jgi:uncharacterized protein (TIGR02145 family)
MINSDGSSVWIYSPSHTDNGNRWLDANDPSPSGWRVPSSGEIETLLDTEKVSNEWTTQNGVKGTKFTDKATGNSIFLPATGSRMSGGGVLSNVGTYGYYWSRTQDGLTFGYCLRIGTFSPVLFNDLILSEGCTVRPVAK